MVGEICTRAVIVARQQEPLVEAARRMRDFHVGNLIVVNDLEDRLPVGILTDRDIAIGPVAQASDRLEALSVGDVMSAPAETVSESESLDAALRKMEQLGVRRLPVVDEMHRLVGVVALDDVLKHVSKQLDRIMALMETERQREHAVRP